MFVENFKLLEAAFTVISFGVHDANLNQHVNTNDVYKVNVAIISNLSVRNDSIEKILSSNGYLPTPFTTNVIPTYNNWNADKPSHTKTELSSNEVHLAFDRVGVQRGEGEKLLCLANGILAEMNNPTKKVSLSIAHNPEEDASYLTLRLHVDVDFDTSLKLDSLLTRELVARNALIPETLSFAVYELE